ncbi:uncharacterized protein LOC143264107 [Megachile rotundata]|uniref:uncharacterized protein LOC143264107 n=1 Tax=Megachile rotundata TaxID=143995 RepID=UPI003FD39C45
MAHEGSGNASVAAVSVKVPPFWVEEPEMWFAQLEGQFLVTGITVDATKFAYVVGNLEGRYAREVADIIKNPPIVDKYDTLKRQLVARLSQSEDKKLRQLLEREELGDRTPSQFLRHLKSLAGEAVPEKLLKSIWSGRLPQSVQTILATQEKAPLEDATILADKVYELAPQGPQSNMAAVEKPSGISAIERKVEELTKMVEQLTTRSRGPWRKRWRGSSRDRSASGNRVRHQNDKKRYDDCWYHYKWGKNAHKCVPPCKYAPPRQEN